MARLSKQSTVDAAKAYDDLTAIKGIREARQQWFRDTMNVHTYRELAALSVDQIETGLKAEKQFPARSMIATWISQANALAEAVDQQIQISGRETVNVFPHWELLASFVIEFQMLKNKDGSRQQRMTAHHIETDTNNVWWGIEPQESMRWMLGEAGIGIQPEPVTRPAESAALPTASAYQTDFSDKLQEVLAKSLRLSRPPLPGQSLTVNVNASSQTDNSALRPTGFSDRMRQVLTRTQES